MKLINKIEEALDKASDTYDKSLLYVIDISNSISIHDLDDSCGGKIAKETLRELGVECEAQN